MIRQAPWIFLSTIILLVVLIGLGARWLYKETLEAKDALINTLEKQLNALPESAPTLELDTSADLPVTEPKQQEPVQGGSGHQTTDKPRQSPQVTQTMQDSPGGVQAGRDVNVNVNTARRLSPLAASTMIEGLKANPCPVTIGVLGAGGAPVQLANQILLTARQALTEVRGVNHGIGFAPFTGIQLKYSPRETPNAAIDVISKSLTIADLDHRLVADPGQQPGAVYIFVGFQP